MRNSNTFSVRIAYIIHGVFSKINPFLSILPKFVSCYETGAPQLCTFTPHLRILCHRPLRKLRVRQVSTGTKPRSSRDRCCSGAEKGSIMFYIIPIIVLQYGVVPVPLRFGGRLRQYRGVCAAKVPASGWAGPAWCGRCGRLRCPVTNRDRPGCPVPA